MAKNFAPRIAKKDRKIIDFSDRLNDLFKHSDERLLKGATLNEIELADIVVKDQVRTKFNDASIKELAANIQENGLIQPLVIHKNPHDNKYTLICGERRFRAMTSIAMKKAPCFVIVNKTPEELMAIQFSENSSREQLHYIDQANGIYNYQQATKATERKIVSVLGISKSEVHRSLVIAKLPLELKEAAKQFDIEKYVLVEYEALEDSPIKDKLYDQIVEGKIRKCTQFKRAIKAYGGKLKRKIRLDNDDLMDLVKAQLLANGKSKKMLKSLLQESAE